MEVRQIQDIASQYVPITSETRIQDIEIPEKIDINGNEIELPNCVLNKDVHFLLDQTGMPIRVAWVSRILAHLLNYYRLGSESEGILSKALSEVDKEISLLIKKKVLQNRRGPGAMSFCQANENVPKDSILISSRTYDTLCSKSKKWRYIKTVAAVRFPNLGPKTTTELKLIVNRDNFDLPKFSPNSLGLRAPQLLDLFKELGGEEEEVDLSGVIDCFYIHPETLKDNFEGDGDGDQIFIVTNGYGKPSFDKIDLTRAGSDIDEDLVQMMLKKANRCERTSISSWLPEYFDDIPIGQATYAIRWMLHVVASRLKNNAHAMQDAWEIISPEAIKLVEFVMDIRKGEWTDEQIENKLRFIHDKMSEIRMAQEYGNWYAKTVTSNSITDIDEFVHTFPNLQSYVDHITFQNSLETINEQR